MHKHHRNVNFHLFSFVRYQFWPLLIPSIAVLFLTFCPQISQSIEVNINDYNQQIENPDRTVAKLAPREIQLTTTLSPPSSLSVPSTSSTSNFDEFIHTLYVISLDGKITAIDAHANGRQLWTVDTGAPLIDSSLSKIEISRDSRSVRLIPSLIGGLYEKYDEDGHVEPLPFDAGDLLDASFKLHEELVITGGKHIDTLGLDLHTGQVLYSFSKDHLKQNNALDSNRTTTDNTEFRSTLIVKRTTQTIRARSARNGYEKWNFSVSNHELLHLRPQPAAVVLGQVDPETAFSGYFEYQLQTGVVLAFDKTGHPTWSSPINAPIAAVWELKNGQLSEKPLFETIASNHFSIDDPRNHHTHSSSSSSSSNAEICNEAGYLQLFTDGNDYLTEENNKKDFSINLNNHVNVYIPNNILTISSVLLGVLTIFLIWYLKQNQFGYKRQESMITESSNSTILTPPSTPDYYQLEQSLTPPFQSRYTLEYEHVRFLGRGGFGVVFEAINKLDQRRVAIKRVSLKKPSGKERALKEIRCLAVLNHPNLIQYYYAWNECPPIGWQEDEDKTLLVRNNINTRDSMSTFPTSAASGNDSESIIQIKHSKLSSVPPINVIKPATTSLSLSDITFDRSSNPLRIDENFSTNSINNDDNNNNNKSDMSSSSSSDDQTNDQLDANNNNKSTTTKRSLSSSSPLFDHSSDLSLSSNEFNEKTPSHKEVTENDDGIIFLHDEQRSSSSPSPIQTQTKSLIEKKKSITNEKDLPTTYFYFVMELCQPETLRDRLMQRTIDRPQAWSIFDQIIKGIEYIHSQKLIHRDLKPSNILFSMDNTVKIGDFGLVSAFGEDKLAKKKKRDDENFDQIQQYETRSTTDGCGNNEVGGTMLYMSPEQINREPYNQKVDIYAMGIILFELLYPFSTQMERMQAIANVRLRTPVFPDDFERHANNRNQLICRLIRWLLSHSSHDRPRASELRQNTFYQRILQLEVPHLFCSDNRQQNQTIINGQDQTLICPQQSQFCRSSSSTFRRSVSSSALHSHRESESGDTESLQ
ncbi:unnamed protein product [Rotaria sordida]|uniref:non-specific serine/threonine protein kinase n=3 Tax=Rotaria sordida TaxID=392033 RepID=A0A813NFD2_9BILA|nr:unnamed protein product [Rotaria sordida]